MREMHASNACTPHCSYPTYYYSLLFYLNFIITILVESWSELIMNGENENANAQIAMNCCTKALLLQRKSVLNESIISCLASCLGIQRVHIAFSRYFLYVYSHFPAYILSSSSY